MTHRLKDNLTSSYVEAANRLNSKRARRKVVAYVESYDDVFFWRQILSQVETDKVTFEVMLPTRERKLERGKKAALMSLLEGKVGQDMVACVDADYDYLIQGASETSRRILRSPYVFHTYAYAIENLQCYAPSLHDVSVAVSLNDQEVFDMEQYLRDFSQAIYPLFVWNIWYYRTSHYSQFTMTDFLHVVEMGKFGFAQADSLIRSLRHKVGKKTEQLRRLHPDAAARSGSAVPDADRRRVLDFRPRHRCDGPCRTRCDPRRRRNRNRRHQAHAEDDLHGRGNVP